MPLEKITHLTQYSFAIWKIDESIEILIDLLSPIEEEKKAINIFKNSTRKKQNITARILLNKLSKTKEQLHYNENGKPFCKTFKYISISHSKDYCIIIASESLIGVDIQYTSIKINNIIKNFASQKEILKFQKNISKLHFLWCAKESIFKTLNKKFCSFKNDIYVDNVKEKDTTLGYYKKGSVTKNYSIYCESFNNYYMSIAIII